MTEIDTDEALYQRVQRGDMAAFDALYGRYEGRLFSFILRMVRNQADAEDIFHEAFLGVLRRPDVRFTQGSFCTWVYRVARNLCYNHARSQRRETGRMQALARTPLPGPGSPEERLQAQQQDQALLTAVAELPAPLAEVYHLRHQGLSYEDMATVLEIPVGTVKSRMHHLVKLLREGLTELETEPWTAPMYKQS